MASLDILCSNHLNLKNKITKIELRKIFCSPWKILKNIPWPINICQKYFIAPTKSPPFIYLMNGPLALPGVILPLKILWPKHLLILNYWFMFIYFFHESNIFHQYFLLLFLFDLVLFKFYYFADLLEIRF